MSGKCEHGLTLRECFTCASPKYPSPCSMCGDSGLAYRGAGKLPPAYCKCGIGLRTAASRTEQLQRELDAAIVRQPAAPAPEPAPEHFTISRDAIVRLCPTCRDALLPTAAPAPSITPSDDGAFVNIGGGPSVDLSAAPAPDDARDAARYRWLRTGAGGCFTDPGDFWGQSDDEIDAAIDAAMREGK